MLTPSTRKNKTPFPGALLQFYLAYNSVGHNRKLKCTVLPDVLSGVEGERSLTYLAVG